MLGSKESRFKRILGFAILFLAIGEGFHIVPRILEIFSTDVDKYQSIIEIGRFVSSITILFFYLMFYRFWSVFYKRQLSKNSSYVLILTGIVGVILSIFLKDNTEFYFVVLRNIPLLVIGLFVISKYRT